MMGKERARSVSLRIDRTYRSDGRTRGPLTHLASLKTFGLESKR